MVPCLIRKTKAVLDSGFHVGGFGIPGTAFRNLFVEPGILIPILSGILDPLSCVPDSKAQYSGFTVKVCWIQDITIKKFPVSRIQIPNKEFKKMPAFESSSANITTYQFLK